MLRVQLLMDGRPSRIVGRSSAAPSGGCGGRTPGDHAAERRSWSPASARTWVTVSSGSGSTSTHPSSRRIFTPSISSTESGGTRSTSSRITAPLRSQGVGTDSWAMWTAGSSRTSADRGRSERASRSSSLASVALASLAGRKSGQMNAPSGDAGEGDVALGRDLLQAGVVGGRPHHLGAVVGRDAGPRAPSSTPGGRCGRRGACSATRRTNSRSGLIGVEHGALVVDDGRLLAVGVDARSRGRSPTRARAARAAHPGRRGRTPAGPRPVLAKGFTASTSAPSFASTDGMTTDAAPCE